jgi:hypothetical protein
MSLRPFAIRFHCGVEEVIEERDVGSWRLAHEHDMNPFTKKEAYVLALDDGSNVPDIDAIIAKADFYSMSAARRGRMWRDYGACWMGGKVKPGRWIKGEIALSWKISS